MMEARGQPLLLQDRLKKFGRWYRGISSITVEHDFPAKLVIDTPSTYLGTIHIHGNIVRALKVAGLEDILLNLDCRVKNRKVTWEIRSISPPEAIKDWGDFCTAYERAFEEISQERKANRIEHVSGSRKNKRVRTKMLSVSTVPLDVLLEKYKHTSEQFNRAYFDMLMYGKTLDQTFKDNKIPQTEIYVESFVYYIRTDKSGKRLEKIGRQIKEAVDVYRLKGTMHPWFQDASITWQSMYRLMSKGASFNEAAKSNGFVPTGNLFRMFTEFYGNHRKDEWNNGKFLASFDGAFRYYLYAVEDLRSVVDRLNPELIRYGIKPFASGDLPLFPYVIRGAHIQDAMLSLRLGQKMDDESAFRKNLTDYIQIAIEKAGMNKYLADPHDIAGNIGIEANNNLTEIDITVNRQYHHKLNLFLMSLKKEMMK